MSRSLIITIRKYLLLTVLVLPLTAAAEKVIYKVIDKDGKVTYTDKKPAANTKYETRKFADPKPPQATKAAPSERTWSITPPSLEQTEKFTGYTTINISSPTHDQTILHDQHEVAVKLALTPTLQENHKAQLLFDGRTIDEPSKNLSFVLTELGRGTHQIQVQIVDASGNVVSSSNSVSIHVKRPIARGPLRLQ